MSEYYFLNQVTMRQVKVDLFKKFYFGKTETWIWQMGLNRNKSDDDQLIPNLT